MSYSQIVACPRFSRPRPQGRLFVVWLLLALLGSWVVWFMTYQSSRLLLPTIGLLLAFGGWAFAHWQHHGPRRFQPLLKAVLSIAFLFSFIFYFVVIFGSSSAKGDRKADAVATALGFEDRDFYLGKKLNYWSGAQWLARYVQKGEKTC